MTIAAGVGLSTKSIGHEAVREAAGLALERSGADRADWGLVFSTAPHRPHYADMLAEVQKVLGTRVLSGCSAWGVLTGSEEVEGRPAVAVMASRSDRIVSTPLLVPAGDDEGHDAALEIARQVSDPPGLLLLMPDPFSVKPEVVLAALGRRVPGIEVVGATASGDPRNDRTYQFYGRNVASRSLAATWLSGALQTRIGITQGCQPLGDVCRVTRSENNLILELDARPALDTLCDRLPEGLHDSLEQLGAHLYVGLPPDAEQQNIEPGEYLVRPLLGVDRKSGTLAVAAPIRQGQPILLVLREGPAARDDLKQVLARLGAEARGARPRFGFYFNCAARGQSLYGIPGIDTAYISGTFGDLPIIGFFGNAEIAPLRGANRLFTYTGVLVLVMEGGD
jgi:small ligand-binding sensory domain FIST